MAKSVGELTLSTTEVTISSALLLLWVYRQRTKRLMETPGRLRQAPISEHHLLTAFRRITLQLAAILLLISVLQVNSSLGADTKVWQEFSGEKALAHVQRLVDLGPHPAGSDAIG